MLLFIGMANAAGVVLGDPGYEQNATGIDRVLNLGMLMFVHARAYPVFAVMFGYGLVQLARRQEASGATPKAVRAVLVRRSVWLVVFGFFHALLLYFGDFLGAYGIIGMIAAIVLLYRSDRIQRIVLWIWAASALDVMVLAGVSVYRLMHSSSERAAAPLSKIDSLVAPDYVTSMFARLSEWPLHTATVVPAIVIVWLGIWAARRQLLDEPWNHQRLLRWVAAVGLGIAFAGGLPLALTSAGILHADSAAISTIFLLHQASGMFGGPGYVALAGVAAAGMSRKSGVIAALGQRSLSAYLFQSVAWLVLFAPFTMGLGRGVRNPVLAALIAALLVWIASLMAAWMMERRSWRGPAEWALRRLTYGTIA
jgi:uncharacterized membrane protein YeiB